MSLIDSNEAAEFLRSKFNEEKMQPGDITISEAMIVWDCSNHTAKKRLEQLVKDGDMLKFYGVLEAGKRGYFFRIIKK